MFLLAAWDFHSPRTLIIVQKVASQPIPAACLPSIRSMRSARGDAAEGPPGGGIRIGRDAGARTASCAKKDTAIQLHGINIALSACTQRPCKVL